MMRLVPVIALGLAICGLAASSAVGASRSVRACSLASVTLRRGALISEKTEQATLPLVMTEHGAGSCVLNGYPSLTLFDRNGHRLRFQYMHNGDEMITGARPKPVTLRAGTSAYFALNKTLCQVHTTRVARALRVAFPGSPGTKTIRLQHYPILGYCAHGFFSRVAVSPFERKPSGTACYAQGSCHRRHQ
jgi:hypothetical protein